MTAYASQCRKNVYMQQNEYLSFSFWPFAFEIRIFRHKVLCINFNYLCKWCDCKRDFYRNVKNVKNATWLNQSFWFRLNWNWMWNLFKSLRRVLLTRHFGAEREGEWEREWNRELSLLAMVFLLACHVKCNFFLLRMLTCCLEKNLFKIIMCECLSDTNSLTTN